MGIKPLGDRLLVRPEKEEEVSKGGILIPENNREIPQRGTVLEVGEKATILPGVRILFSQYSGTEIFDKNKQLLLIMREEEIFAIEN